ncbi:hypothetical protein HY441_01965 [Candidatus Microgenomates bacterium]|nr:hypothetical protein [Candidatus Microgenomates bacterium]
MKNIAKPAKQVARPKTQRQGAKLTTQPPIKSPHPHAKWWMLATAVVVVVAAVTVAVFLIKARNANRAAQDVQPAQSELTGQATAPTADTKQVTTDLSGINIQELKDAVTEVKNTFE